MPRFFIDTSDQLHFVRDEVGLELEDVEVAKNAAVAALPDMMRDALPDGESRTFSAIVRNQDGKTVLHASLIMTVVWTAPTT